MRILRGMAFLVGISSTLYLHAQTDEHGKSYYVVIGAFTYEQNAKDFIEAWVKPNKLEPVIQFNKERKFFYVFTMRDKHWGIPVQEAERIRKLNPKFDQTWVYYGNLDPIPTPVAQSKVEEVKAFEETKEVEVEQNQQESQLEAPKEIDYSKTFYFQLKAEDGTILKSPIEIVDLDSSKLRGLISANENFKMLPINKSGRIMAQVKLFGYRLKQVGIDFNNPSDSAGIKLDSGIYKVPITLKPLTVGDIAIMYNVFFFKDAGIMRPDSKYEVNSLVSMMQTFPNRRIIIHGHTNGSHRGKILKMNKDKNFFALDGAVQYIGSATTLSEDRAKCIEEYLVANGISKDRMEIKAWGGKKMLFSNDHERAIENVRVEVEIVKD